MWKYTIAAEEEEDEQAKDRSMTIEDGENGNVKYVIFALPTCQLPVHVANIKQSHAHEIYRRGENQVFHSFVCLFGCVCVCACVI